MLKEDFGWFGIVMAALGIILLAVAVFGRKKTIDSAIDGIDFIYHLEALLS